MASGSGSTLSLCLYACRTVPPPTNSSHLLTPYKPEQSEHRTSAVIIKGEPGYGEKDTGVSGVALLLVQGTKQKSTFLKLSENLLPPQCAHRRKAIQSHRKNKNVFMSSSILNSGFCLDILQPTG